MCALRAFAVLSIVLCSSCAGPPRQGGAHPQTGKPLGHSGCGPPITYQVFQKDAFGVDWSKVAGLLAYNAKGGDGAPGAGPEGPAPL